MGSKGRLSCAFAALLLLVGCDENLTIVPKRDKATGPEIQPLACVPNLDGKIDSNELAAAIGVDVNYVVSPPGAARDVDLEGKPVEGGRLSWSFSADFADDQALVITPALAKDQWYAASFAPDAFVTPFDAGGRIDSIGRLTDQGLEVLGLASHEENPSEGQTLLIYGAPIQILKFPIQPGVQFVSTGTITNGKARGLQYAGKDTYEVSVDGIGSVDLPAFSFEEVHRVRTKVTVEPAVGAPATQIQVSFFAECFGEVVRATSESGEMNPGFTQAAELRRLGF
jgi:hypothetical protein